MKKIKKNKMGQKKSGFTLIELLVVIVIIGILSVVSIPRFNGHNEKARDAGRQISLDAMSVILFAGRAEGNTFDYDKISNGVTTTTLTHLQNTLQQRGQIIPSPSGNRSFWYFSVNNEFLIAVCSEADLGTLYSKGTYGSSAHVECTTNNTTPTAVASGRFDGETNFEMLP